ncbi:MAG TPA: XRE family transcriptional regulator [Candidatus Acidoferrales bacterium]|nr:XRE family transcriptional regulator [Candidatus Acidoferrales bacterium]
MIKNERQYQMATTQLTRLRGAEQELEQRARPQSENPLRQKLELDAVRGQSRELAAEIAEYDALRSGATNVPPIRDLADIPRALIAKRIAAGMTQKQLADAIGVAEQQIQRYEANNYASASLTRLKEVAQALDLSSELPSEEPPAIDAILRKMSKSGFDRAFFERRLLSEVNMTSAKDARAPVLDFVGRLSRVFGWRASSILSGAELSTPHLAMAVSYKKPKSHDATKADVFAAYAAFCSDLILRTTDLRPRPLADDPAVLREAITAEYGEVCFETIARYSWDHGIALLPFSESGGFHSAIFRQEDGRAVVVLTQKTPARWAFDTGHELGHYVRHPRETIGIVEQDDISQEDEEAFASDFAATVLLGPNSEELTRKAIRLADRDITKLKSAVLAVSKEARINPGYLGFHLAHRLRDEGQDRFWGVAQNLNRETDFGAVDFARKLLFERVDWGALEDIDRDILMRAVR